MLTFEDISQTSPSLLVQDALLGDPRLRDTLATELWGGSLHDATPFGTLLPGLRDLRDPAPCQNNLGVRASNVLRANGFGSWRELAECSALGLRRIPNLGYKTFLEIIDMILRSWAEADHFDVQAIESSDDLLLSAAPDPVVISSIADVQAKRLARLLRWLWAHRGSRTFAEAVADAASLSAHDVPPDIRECAIELGASDLSHALHLESFDAEDWDWLLEFDERSLTILERRTYAEPALTLDQLATRFGLTRERIRQIEGVAADELAVRLTAPRARGLLHLAARLRREATGLVTGERFDGLIERLLSDSAAPESHRSLCRGILARAAGDWLTWNGHIACAELVRSVERTIEDWRNAGPTTAIPLPALDDLLAQLEAPDPSPVILEALAVRLIDDTPVWWGRTHGDRGVAVLTAYDRVLTFGEIHAAIGPSASPRSLQNALLAEGRIMRRGKETYGLRAWGGEEYTGLYDELEQAIERGGGRVPLTELVERFVDQFGVKAGSVLSYAADRRFVKHPDGTIAMRTAADPEVAYSHVPIELTPGAYRLDGIWHACFEIEEELIRGSGRVIRRGIGQEAGLEPDLTFAVIYDAGTVTFSWGGNQPAIGSLRELIARHAVSRGDLLLLPLSGAEPRPSRVVRWPERAGWSGVARIAAEMGLAPDEVDEDEEPLEVADALGLPPGADWHAIADRLRDRKDRRIIEFLPEHLR